MPHELHIGAERPAPREVTDIGPVGAMPLLRAHRQANGTLVLIASEGATCDGVPLLGNLAVISCGTGALLRAGGTRVEVVWQPRSERCAAAAGCRCRVCFGAFAADAMAVLCVCEAYFHHECHAVLINCPGCGALPEVQE
jgi:hypothetical protein